MKVIFAEPVTNAEQGEELRIGSASWDENAVSIKYAWRDCNGKVTRGGEIPIESLPQMFSFAIRKGYLKLGAAT